MTAFNKVYGTQYANSDWYINEENFTLNSVYEQVAVRELAGIQQSRICDMDLGSCSDLLDADELAFSRRMGILTLSFNATILLLAMAFWLR